MAQMPSWYYLFPSASLSFLQASFSQCFHRVLVLFRQPLGSIAASSSSGVLRILIHKLRLAQYIADPWPGLIASHSAG